MKIRHLQYLSVSLALVTILSSCASLMPSQPKPDPDDNTLQGWNEDQKMKWYRGSQGSRLIPERWLKALESPDSTVAFLDPQYFGQFGYLRSVPYSEEALPIGFARDVQSDKKLTRTNLRWYKKQKKKEPWVGLNCAACHTSEIEYNGKKTRIDGSATLADFQGFTDNLYRSLTATYTDSAKWDRFASKVLKPDGKTKVVDNAENRAMLRSAFEKHLSYRRKIQEFNQTDSEYGHGRLDAVGHILNKVAFLTEAEGQISGEPDAPVSYPFIWNAAQHDFLQWNGIVPNDKIRLGRGNIDAGALVRNTSEVIGVFADVKVEKGRGLKGYPSSVDVDNLIAMEIQLSTLKSPDWTSIIGPIDKRKARLGERLFKQSCAGCHASLDRNDLKTPIIAEMTPVWGQEGLGTDPWMACNAYSYQALSGVLAGEKALVIAGDRLPEDYGPTRGFLRTQAAGSLLGKKFSIIKNVLKIAAGRQPDIDVALEGFRPGPPTQQASKEARLQQCINDADQLDISEENKRLLAYKGRPLNGIWATAPYLHNGSVKSLYELMLPPAQRASKFWVGNKKFDPVHVGYVDSPSTVGSWFRTHGDDGKPIHGNSNTGHDYGNALFSEEERWAIVEYMKSL